MKQYPVNYKAIPKKDKASVALAATMFVTELAYEVAARWVPILRQDRKIFKQSMRHDLKRFETAVKGYNSWLTYATGTGKNLGYIRFISDELNCYADDELYKLMLSTKNIYDRSNCPDSMTLARLDTLFYMFLLANINAKANMVHLRASLPNASRFEPMALTDAMRILEGIRMRAYNLYAPDMTITDEEEKHIEHGITAIVHQLMKHSNEVCSMVNVELPKEMNYGQ